MKIKSVIGVLCAGLLLGGCAQTSNSSKFTGEKNTQPDYQSNLNIISPQAYSSINDLNLAPGTYISIIGKGKDSAYWKTVKKGAEQAAEDLNEKLGYTGNDKIKVIYSAPDTTENIDQQVNLLDEELNRYPDAVGIACIDAAAYTTQFDQAEENGIPLVAFDSGNDYKDILCISKTNNQEAAATGASKLCDELGNKGKILVLASNSNSSSVMERVDGIRQELESHPDVEISKELYYDQIDEMKKAMADELCQEQEQKKAEEKAAENPESADNASDEEENAEDDTEDQIDPADITDVEVLEYYLEKDKEITGIYAVDESSVDWALQAKENMLSDENLKLVGFDAGKEHLKALEDEKIDGLVVQNPFGMGYAAVVSAARAILGIGNEAVVDTGYVWVTRDNLDTDSIQKVLYE